MKNRTKMPKYRRIHRVFGLILIGVTVLASISGIILNHRQLFSGFDLPRNVLSEDYSYEKGRQAALRGSAKDSMGNIFLFGDAGVWLKKGSEISAYNDGFASGADNNRVYDILWFNDRLVAATHFGLFTRTGSGEVWVQIKDMGENQYVDLFYKDQSLVVLSRDGAFITNNLQEFTQISLPAPEGYQQRTSLFTFLWNVHSGEVMGTYGKVFVDFLALILLIISITGFIRFYLPAKLKGATKRLVLLRLFKKNRKLHKFFGIYCGIFLIVTIITGMFLRPPLLIPIVGVDVGVIPGTHLDNPNPWQDKLRKGLWDNETQSFVFATKDGMYGLQNQQMKYFASQPPISVMGCTVLQNLGDQEYLVGSFSGFFVWQSVTGQVRSALTGKIHSPQKLGRPISADMITGVIEDNGHYYLDYRKGIVALSRESDEIVLPLSFVDDAKMSLWNFALEVHTGRIFESVVNMFYIFYVPISGLMFLLVVGTGYWWHVRPKLLKKK